MGRHFSANLEASLSFLAAGFRNPPPPSMGPLCQAIELARSNSMRELAAQGSLLLVGSYYNRVGKFVFNARIGGATLAAARRIMFLIYFESFGVPVELIASPV